MVQKGEEQRRVVRNGKQFCGEECQEVVGKIRKYFQEDKEREERENMGRRKGGNLDADSKSNMEMAEDGFHMRLQASGTTD